MLNASIQETIRAAYTALPGLLPGFRSRAGQREMIGVASRALAGGSVALVEAPTGTGKTIGYLLPGIVIAASLGKRLVVSTATVALQEQVARKDYPLAARAAAQAGASSSVAVLKGRERYCCPVRLKACAGQGDLFVEGGAEPLGAMAAALDSGAWDGDRDHWPEAIDEQRWRQVNNQRALCAGRRCPAFRTCPHALALEAAMGATVVVATHDLVLASLARAPKSIFSRFEQNLFVFDEGHALSDRALSASALSASLDAKFLHEAPAALSRAGQSALEPAAKAAAKAAAAAFGSVAALFDEIAPGGGYRFPFGRLPQQVACLERCVLAPLERLEESLASALEALSADASALAAAPDRLSFLASTAERVGREREAWSALFAQDGRAAWISRERRCWHLHVSPFSAAHILERLLWREARGVVITSATLSACGAFDHTLAELGLGGRGDVECARLASPFDWSRVRIVVPKDALDPRREEEHTRAAAAAIEAGLRENEGGVLALFSSERQLARARDLIDPSLAPFALAQGEAPVPEIVRRHRARIDAGEPSAILGLASFYEGVDLPGRYLTLVILAKIPFPAPDEPLLAAAAERLEAEGLSAFGRLYLPIASRRLAQAAGRLMRREDDWGEIRILDRRIVERSYGRLLAASLPAPVSRA